MENHSYGWLREPKDKRDYLLRYRRGIPLPAKVDLRQYCSAIQNQGSLGSCTGFAIADGMREFLLNRLGILHTELSPLFLYYLEREMMGTIDHDSGGYIRDGFKILNQVGVAPEEFHPYNILKFRERPSIAAYEIAAEFKVFMYQRIVTLQDIKTVLARGFGCAFGFLVKNSFESEQVRKTGIMPLPKCSEKIFGGHAVFCCGYDDSLAYGSQRGYLIVKNSWGEEWGDKGYFYMPYAYVTQFPGKNVSDIWTAEA